MKEIEPINQTSLFGLSVYINELIELDNKKKLPNKILLSGQKGLGKSTLAYHFINYILSKDEEFKYNVKNFEINVENRTYKTILNKSNPNLIVVDVGSEKKMIDINQIRELIQNLNKSSFNRKPRFVLIDNIEFLNVNSINALLKILEEPNLNIHFILIHNNRKILSTLLSRCINFKIFLTNNQSLDITESLLNADLKKIINKDLINYYFTPGNIYNIVRFADYNKYDLTTMNLKDFIKIIINNNHYKKGDLPKYLIFELIELYFKEINLSFSTKIYNSYCYFLKKISDTKTYNLDEETLFMEFEEEILNG